MRFVWILLSTLMLASSAPAEPLTDIEARTHVTANGSWMVMTKGDDWSGASLGGTLLYNLHPKLSVFGAYEHGMPVNSLDPHLNIWRAVGSLRIHPNAFAGFGYAWFDKRTDGALAQLVVYKTVLGGTGHTGTQHLALDFFGSYSHVFPRGDLPDFEWYKVGVNLVSGKE